MKNTLFVGDMHLQMSLILKLVTKAINTHNIEHVIFIGDYTDQFGCTDLPNLYISQLNLLNDWVSHYRNKNVQVTLLIGNHDIPYLINRPEYYSLKTDEFSFVSKLLWKQNMQVAVNIDNYIISHAGYINNNLPKDWHLEPLTYNHIEDLYDLNENVGLARGGYGKGSPVWSDLYLELLPNQNIKNGIQIVGHTPVKTIEILNNEHLFGIDTFSLDQNYNPIGDGSLLAFIDNKSIIIHNDEWLSNEFKFERIKLLTGYDW